MEYGGGNATGLTPQKQTKKPDPIPEQFSLNLIFKN